MTERCCDDVAVHGHDGQLFKNGRPYAYRFAFRLRWPWAGIVRTADRAPWAVLNRYPGVVIGIALKVGHRRMLSILWGTPGRVIEVTA